MSYVDDLSNDDPIELRDINALIKTGFVLDLLLQHKEEDDKNIYYLYAQYSSHIRPIITQRNSHRSFASLDRAIEWGKRVGFKNAFLSIDYSLFSTVKE